MLPGRQAKDIDADDVVLGLDAETIRRSFVEKLFFELAKFPGVATRNDHCLALARAVRDRMLHRWIRTARTYLEEQTRTVIYLSAEYLLGPQLGHNLLNLGIEGPARKAMESLGLNIDELIEHEEEPGLGNGGLGRLAACFMDSLATLDFGPSATAFAMSSASSIRRSGTAGRWSAPTAGCDSATPGRSAGTRSSTPSASAGAPRPPWTPPAAPA